MDKSIQQLYDQMKPSKEYPHRPLRLLILASGSVASIKIASIVSTLQTYGNIHIQVASTHSALHFISLDKSRVWTDEDEWKIWRKQGDPVLHIELRRWADVVLLAPCSANTLAKVSNGICDNLVTCILRALDLSRTPVYIFPAMNTAMYQHPITARQLDSIMQLGYIIKGPISKNLACGDTGIGAMIEWMDIVHLVVDIFKLKKTP